MAALGLGQDGAKPAPAATDIKTAGGEKAAAEKDKAAGKEKSGGESDKKVVKSQLELDTEELSRLAAELKAEMDKSTKDTLSVGVVKKAEAVEKLAKKVETELKASLGK